MIKEIRCPECDSITETQRVCDICGSSTFEEGKYCGVPIDLEFSYGSPLDGNKYCFCSLQCLKKFVDDEITKELK